MNYANQLTAVGQACSSVVSQPLLSRQRQLVVVAAVHSVAQHSHPTPGPCLLTPPAWHVVHAPLLVDPASACSPLSARIFQCRLGVASRRCCRRCWERCTRRTAPSSSVAASPTPLRYEALSSTRPHPFPFLSSSPSSPPPLPLALLFPFCYLPSSLPLTSPSPSPSSPLPFPPLPVPLPSPSPPSPPLSPPLTLLSPCSLPRRTTLDKHLASSLPPHQSHHSTALRPHRCNLPAPKPLHV